MTQFRDDILNYLEIYDWLGTAGQPNKEQYPLIKALGYQVVINLAMPDSPGAFSDEAQVAKEMGLFYYHIPVVWENPKREDLEEFFRLMRKFCGKKIFLHCALNMRVSVFVFLYRVLVLGEQAENAREMIYEIWEPNEIWRQFIDTNLPADQADSMNKKGPHN